MQRRDSIKQIAFMIGGSLWVPSCLNRAETGVSEEEEILADWVDWLIPETDTPGAKALRVDLFVSKMFRDCHDQETRQKLSDDLKLLAKHTDKAWRKCTAEQKKQVFDHFLLGEKPGLASFGTVKRRTIQGYTSSEYFVTEVSKYEMAPGRYNGYFPATKPS